MAKVKRPIHVTVQTRASDEPQRLAKILGGGVDEGGQTIRISVETRGQDIVDLLLPWDIVGDLIQKLHSLGEVAERLREAAAPPGHQLVQALTATEVVASKASSGHVVLSAKTAQNVPVRLALSSAVAAKLAKRLALASNQDASLLTARGEKPPAAG